MINSWDSDDVVQEKMANLALMLAVLWVLPAYFGRCKKRQEV